MPANPREILVARAGVDDHAKPRVRHVVGDEIVDDAAALGEHAAVERLAGLVQLADIVGEQLLQEGPHLLAVQIHDAHVRDIEDAGRSAHGVVLTDLRAVLHRHVPAAEVDDSGAQLGVQVEERSTSSHCVSLQVTGARAARHAQTKRAAGTHAIPMRVPAAPLSL